MLSICHGRLQILGLGIGRTLRGPSSRALFALLLHEGSIGRFALLGRNGMILVFVTAMFGHRSVPIVTHFERAVYGYYG